MPPVAVIILHPEPGPIAGPLERLLGRARAEVAASHRAAFVAAGADDVRVEAREPDGLPFGRRLAGLAARLTGRPLGLVVVGSGAAVLARPADLVPFVQTARSAERIALANNRYSADLVAIARVDELPAIPDLPGDNALPRWLEERAGWRVADLRARWRLQVDLDSPLDLLLTGVRIGIEADDEPDGPWATVRDRLAGVRGALADPRAEVLVAGRTSAASLLWLERRAAARVRALVEERGLRASSPLALGGGTERPGPARPPRSVLGLALDRDGPAAVGMIVAGLADAAIVDTRVLLAHRLGADEGRWPGPEDRFASDLLLPAAIADPWLRELTASAAAAPIPILLGGHTLVGPGVRSLTARRPARATRR